MSMEQWRSYKDSVPRWDDYLSEVRPLVQLLQERTGCTEIEALILVELNVINVRLQNLEIQVEEEEEDGGVSLP